MTSAAEIRGYIERDVSVSYRLDRGYAARQRTFDLVVGLTALMVTSPVIAAAALAIWIEDRGMPLFTQQRVGQFGRLFTIYKLRTMRLEECRDAISPSAKGDRRITRVGAFLRKTSIDELPQLLNVVGGSMSIVGPRPEMPFVVNRYERWQHCRHLRKPGITGLWQISVRKTLPLHDPAATKIDLEYVRIASTRNDTRIFFLTLESLLTSKAHTRSFA